MKELGKRMKRQGTAWEKIWANHIQKKKLLYKIYSSVQFSCFQISTGKILKESSLKKTYRWQIHTKTCSISYIIKEMQIKPHSITHILEWSKSRIRMTPNTGEDVEQQEF